MAKHPKGFKIEDLPAHLQAIARHKLAGGGDDRASEAVFYAAQGVAGIPALCNCGVERDNHESQCASAYTATPKRLHEADSHLTSCGETDCADGCPYVCLGGGGWGRDVKKPTEKRTKSRGMNKTETCYAAYLEVLKVAGEILSYEFEAIRLNIGERAWYTPDFFVLRHTIDTERPGNALAVEFHEVKGSWKAKNQRDARTRIKSAAKQFPHFEFLAVTKNGGGWDREVFG